MPKRDGITVRCIGCKKRKLLSFDEAAALTFPPMCDDCGSVMVAESARVSS